MARNPIISVEGLTLRYEGAEQRSLEDVSFDVSHGEVFGILGATGAGKSTLLKCLAGVIPHHEGDAAHRGRIEVFGKELGAYASLAEITSDVGLVMQDPEVQLVNTVVRDELIWGMENRGVAIDEIDRRIDRAAELFDIIPLLERFTHALSGGEKQRVVLASIFCLNPSVMLLDEPTSELDPAGTESVMRAVQVLADEGVTVLMIEHKVEELAVCADRLLVLDKGQVSDIGTPREIFAAGRVPYRPQVLDVALGLREQGVWPSQRMPLSIDEAVDTWTDGMNNQSPQDEEVAG